jgi:glutamate-1-semialdehyde 2,1-aminomutase
LRFRIVVEAVADTPAADIREAYRKRTPGSSALIDRGAGVLPAGSSRSFSYFDPYPVVFDHGEGPLLWDVDGNRYIDFVNNGLSLIHGNAYPPIIEAVAETLPMGTAWPGTSTEQIEFAELLCARVAIADQVRFTNTGTEATMLAVKLARYLTGRPLILKAWHGYHGFYDDLSAGLEGQGEIPDRVVLAEFGDASGFAAKLAEHGDEIAAVILEPVPYTGRVTPPPDGFLNTVQALARAAGALSVIDDCLMFRLAPGGSSQKFGLEPDIVCLGKWIGGGFPVGAIAAGEDLMTAFDERQDEVLSHGGSFNGNPIGCVAGRIAVEDLTQEQIHSMDRLAAKLVAGLERGANAHEVPLSVRGVGSAFGVYVLGPDGEPSAELTSQLQLAALVNGVYLGPEGELSMSTPMTDALVEEALERLDSALARVAPLVTSMEEA